MSWSITLASRSAGAKACKQSACDLYFHTSYCETNQSRFHCLFYFGYEQRRSQSSGILAADISLPIPLYRHIARNALQRSKIVTIYMNGDTTRTVAFKEAVGSKAAIEIDEHRFTPFTLGDRSVNVTISFATGGEKYEAFLAPNPEVRLRSAELVKELGLEISPKGTIVVQGPFGETSVPGIFVAGDAMTTLRTIPNAFGTGVDAASGVFRVVWKVRSAWETSFDRLHNIKTQQLSFVSVLRR
jgi:hypothetical protein